ncbi:MAG: hypothetical protein KatS3mg003_1077 [Candidatus Nitrosocaldaceae archaeon]|nr:MAG: hypothetical protein KatS3mg003_1077 [Candidatus Nitrosocaldaceae archaeon]
MPKSKVKKYSLDYIIKSINKYDIEKRYFLLYLLTTGLRVREAHYSIKHHNEVCDGKIISLNWSKGHKRAYETFCIIHDLVDKIKVGKTTWFYYYHYNEDKLKFPLRYLRKVNFTLTSMYVNPIIAKYIQGRMLNTIDMANYFIPMLDEFYDKYRNYWDKIIERIMS